MNSFKGHALTGAILVLLFVVGVLCFSAAAPSAGVAFGPPVQVTPYQGKGSEDQLPVPCVSGGDEIAELNYVYGRLVSLSQITRDLNRRAGRVERG